MEDREKEQFVDIADLSGGVQSKTTEFLQKQNEQEDAQNTRYDSVGGIKRSLGYEQIGSDLTSTTSTSTSSSTTTTSTSSSSSTSSSTSTTTTA
jgi:hypothetical protein